MDEAMTYEEFQEKVGGIILTAKGHCPVTPVVQMLQGKWKLQILYELCIRSPMRFGELKKALTPITNAMLTNALKELEEKVGFAARYRRVQQKLEELEQLVIDARFECTGPSACLTTTEYADTLTKMLGIIRSIDEANED